MLLEDQVCEAGSVSSSLEELLKDGIASAQRGDRDAARDYLLRAAEVGPRCEDAWMWLASISEYPEELLAFLNNVLAINPDNAKAREWHMATRSLLARTFVERAAAAQERGAFVDALDALNEALRHDSRCEAAWTMKAHLTEDPYQKMQFFTEVLEINPDNPEAASWLRTAAKKETEDRWTEATDLLRTGDTTAGLSVLQGVAEAQPEHVESRLLIALFADTIAAKLRALDEVLAIDETHVVARVCRELLSVLGTTTEAEPESVVESDSAPSQAPPHPSTALDLYAQEAGDDDQVPEVYEAPLEPADTDVSSPAPRKLIIDMAPEFDPYETVTGLYDQHARDLADRSREEVAEAEAMLAAMDAAPHEVEVEYSAPEFQISYGENQIEDASEQVEPEWGAEPSTEWHEPVLNTSGMNDGLAPVESGIADVGLHSEHAEEVRSSTSEGEPQNHVNPNVNDVDSAFLFDESNTRHKTILVVDDSPTVRKLITSKLEKCGHRVIAAIDGVDALERIDAELPDLVLLDITMPRMDGYEVCRQIRLRQDAKTLPIIMISGKDGFFDKVRGRMAGTTGYVTKPFGPETLMKALEAYLSQERVLEAQTSAVS
jgi:twitching motility two-component system response regulator PilG